MALLLLPVMPGSAPKMLAALGLSAEISSTGLLPALAWGQLPAGTRLEKAEALFPRLEVPEAKTAAATEKTPQMAPVKPQIELPIFSTA